jgi:hypothetical protein
LTSFFTDIFAMPKTPSSGPVKKPAARKTPVTKKMPAKKKTPRAAKATKTPKRTAKSTPARKPVAARKVTSATASKRVRAPVLNEHPANIVFEKDDTAAGEALAQRAAKTPVRVKGRRSAVDRLDDPPPGEESAAALVHRLSGTIERELSRIETIVSGRDAGARRGEAESRARVLASLARTLKEVKRLRDEAAQGEAAKDADDDAVPRDLDEFRRVLSRRLDEMVAGRAPLSAGDDEPR